MKNVIISSLFLLLFGGIRAQSPVSGFMEGKGNSSTAVSFSNETYGKVFLVPNKINGVPVFNDVKVTSVSLYNSYGVTDNFDLSIGVPYIKTEGNATEGVLKELNYANTRSGFQDISINAKVRVFSKQMDASKLDFLVTGGIKTPTSKYEVNEGLQSILAIGNGATQVNGIAGAHLFLNSGLFFTTQIGYSLRTKRAPNALIGEMKAGFAHKRFYADVFFAGQTSDSGTNILGEGFDGVFPATDVSYHKTGLTVYIPLGGGFGISGAATKLLNGRNIGDATGISGSIVYQIR
jgi:hypothetical protein